MKAVHPLQAYKRHITSEFLADRYPYLEDIRGHLKDDDITMAAGDRLFPRLVEQLTTPTMAPEKLVEALRTICDLCAHQENKCQAIASDVMSAATNLLMHDSIPVRRDAARVICSMSLLMGGRSQLPMGNSSMARKLTGAMGAGPTLPRLAKLLLSCGDELVKMHVAEALRAIATFRDGCQQVVDMGTVKGIAQYLCGTLPDLPATRELSVCLLQLLNTLASVTLCAHNGTRDIFGTSLLAKVIGFLARVPSENRCLPAVSQEESTEIVRQALRLLWHCGNDPRGRREMLKADGVRTVTEYLDHADAKVREAAVCALNVISLETQGKEHILLHSLAPLAELLHSDAETVYLHETCVQLCRSASELPAFRFAFARQIVGTTWLLDKVYGTAALAAVSPLLSPSEDTEVRSQAVTVVAHFLQARTPSQGDEIRVPPVAQLANIEQPAAFAFEECMDILHNLVSLTEIADAREPALICLDILTDLKAPRETLRKLVRGGMISVPKAAEPELEELLQKEE